MIGRRLAGRRGEPGKNGAAHLLAPNRGARSVSGLGIGNPVEADDQRCEPRIAIFLRTQLRSTVRHHRLRFPVETFVALTPHLTTGSSVDNGYVHCRAHRVQIHDRCAACAPSSAIRTQGIVPRRAVGNGDTGGPTLPSHPAAMFYASRLSDKFARCHPQHAAY
jgi:hypothetical protein